MAWQDGIETFKALKALVCLSLLLTEKAHSQSTPVNVAGLSLAAGCTVIVGEVPLRVTAHFSACSVYL